MANRDVFGLPRKEEVKEETAVKDAPREAVGNPFGIVPSGENKKKEE